ncbi:MAG: hypothetical protein HY831_05360 [Candidatus Aenigmarchaeota archaeon]|nr:hypothetical protein [Candidatus Aenigmarchaeota archaeon]
MKLLTYMSHKEAVQEARKNLFAREAVYEDEGLLSKNQIAFNNCLAVLYGVFPSLAPNYEPNKWKKDARRLKQQNDQQKIHRHQENIELRAEYGIIDPSYLIDPDFWMMKMEHNGFRCFEEPKRENDRSSRFSDN